jgi:hypothetical protein
MVQRWLCIYLTILALLVPSGCYAASRPMGEPGWFSVNVPDGFKLSSDRQSGRIQISSGQSVVDIQPMSLPGTRSPAQVAAILASVSRQWGDTTRWGDPHPMNVPGRMSFRQFGRDADLLRISSATFVSTANGAVGLVTMVTAEEDTFDQNKSVFQDVLQSFRPAAGSPSANSAPPPSSGPAQSNLTYVRWTDPKEQGFSIEVPRGWSIEGGMIRVFNGAVPVIFAWSEGRAIMIQMGDSRYNSLVGEPMPQAPVATPGTRRYIPAMEFLPAYLRDPKAVIKNVRFDFVRRLPELEASVVQAQNALSGGGMLTEAQVAQTRFHATYQGHDAVGYYLATTIHTRLPDLPVGTWMISLLQPAGFVAPPERAAEAEAALDHMVHSFQYNPQWVGQNGAAAVQSAQIWHDASEKVNSTIVNGYYDRQRQIDKTMDRDSNARRGTSVVLDEQTGQRYQVESGSNYHWITNGGLVAGTDTPFNPAPLYFRQMMELPR